jgi:hypothetical protein
MNIWWLLAALVVSSAVVIAFWLRIEDSVTHRGD